MSLDIRDASHVRQTVNLITAQCAAGSIDIDKSLQETIDFGATLNSTDLVGEYGRALVHCATASLYTTGHDKIVRVKETETSDSLYSLLAMVPQQRLVHVIENACTHMFRTLHDLYLKEGVFPSRAENRIEACLYSR